MSYFRFTVIMGLCLWTAVATAQTKAPMRKQTKRTASPGVSARPQPSSGTIGGALAGEGGQRALEIKGQTRNVSSMLVRQSAKDSIDFVKLRKNYHGEIVGTKY
jgi:FAD/FMN-containing dehydrogenase